MISELEAAERWAWVALLLMAGDSNEEGKIFLRKNTEGNLIGYSTATLSELLGLEVNQLKSAMTKMLKYDKIKIDKNGVIEISNWKKYQSEYQRQKQYREPYKESDNKKCNLDSNQSNLLDRDIDIEKEKEKNKRAPNDKNPSKPPSISFEFDGGYWTGITGKDKELWFKAYPACDIDQELMKMADWLISNPAKKKKNYRAFISRWLSKEQDRGGSIKGNPVKKYASDTWKPPKDY